MSKAIKSVSATFGSTTLPAKVAPVGRGYSSDPTDVTTLTDEEEKFVPGSLVKNKEIQIQTLDASALEINTVGSLVINASVTDGATTTQKTATIPNCILKDIEPPNPEAGGDRANFWTLTFQPGGASATPATTGNT